MTDVSHSQLYSKLAVIEQKVDLTAQGYVEFRSEVRDQHRVIDGRLTEGSKQFATLLTKMEGHDSSNADHESRLRELEKDMNRDNGSKEQTGMMRNWIAVVISAAALLIAFLKDFWQHG